jgi:hypothetical protein
VLCLKWCGHRQQCAMATRRQMRWWAEVWGSVVWDNEGDKPGVRAVCMVGSVTPEASESPEQDLGSAGSRLWGEVTRR